MTAIHAWQAVVLGTVEELTEFMPVSSTAHLRISESLMSLPTVSIAWLLKFVARHTFQVIRSLSSCARRGLGSRPRDERPTGVTTDPQTVSRIQTPSDPGHAGESTKPRPDPRACATAEHTDPISRRQTEVTGRVTPPSPNSGHRWSIRRPRSRWPRANGPSPRRALRRGLQVDPPPATRSCHG